MQINWAEVSAAIFGLFFSHAASVRLGNGTLSASAAGGVPAHLTIAQVLQSLAMCFAGLPASIQSGDVTLTYTPFAAVVPPAPPTSA